MKQNITLSIDSALIRKARILAATRETSVSKLLAEELKRLVDNAENYERAHRHAMTLLQRGFRFGGRPADREALHDRQGLR